MTPKLSIIISTWNCLEHIKNCLSSIESLGLSSYEIIVVDSGSKDGTVEYARSVKNPFLNVYADGRRLKWSEANQIGLDNARGDWICLSNPDIVFNDSFSKMLQECEKDNLPAAAPQLVFPNGGLQPPSKIFTPWIGLCALSRTLRLILKKVRYTDYKFAYDSESEERVKVDCPQGSLFVIQRRVLDALGGRLWNEGYLNGFSDLEAFLNMRRAGFQMWLFPQYRVIHYGSYVTKKYPTWIEKDQARGFVLYLRYWKFGGRMPPNLSIILFGLDGIASVALELFWRVVKRRTFWNPPFIPWQAGERIVGIIEGLKAFKQFSQRIKPA